MLYPVRGRSLRPDRIACAVTGARELLRRLGNSSETPRIPLQIRHEARTLLRFFPPRSSLFPVLSDRYQLLEHPMPKVFPQWPEYE